MDVNKANFIELLPKINSAIDKADFIAIDTELSGLARDRSFNLFDTQEERYTKIKQSSLDYLMIQFGLAIFSLSDKDKGHLECECYNFYIFPYKTIYSSKPFDRSFLVQPSALQFLVNHGFDFNKWVKEGINYLNMEEEEKFLETLKKKEEEKSDTSKNYVPEEHKEFIDEFIDSLEKFVNDSDKERLELTPCSAYRRKLIYESARRFQFENIRLSTCLVSPNSTDRFIAIDKVTEEKKKFDKQNLILETVGMSKVIQHIIKSKKPIVGHNVLLDLMHIIHHFIVPLPDSYSCFKTMLKELFSVCYDTKLIATTSEFKNLLPNTALNDLFSSLKSLISKSLEVKIINASPEYLTRPKYHQAGYDAYITGLVFVYLNMYINDNNLISSSTSSQYLPKFINKLHFPYSYDINHLDIDLVKETVPDRSHVFHLTFPSIWRESEIVELFSPYGSVVIGFINDTSAFVALKDKDKLKEAAKELNKKCQSLTYSLSFYSEHISKDKYINSMKRKNTEIHSLNSNECENNNSNKKSKVFTKKLI